jgi:hypothetical protein
VVSKNTGFDQNLWLYNHLQKLYYFLFW